MNLESGAGGQIEIPGFEGSRPKDVVPAVKAEIPPTIEEWVDLYTAAGGLKSLAPWTWMCDDEVFGVKVPESRTVGYCSVMGNLGEHLALGVSLGSAGLAGLETVRRMKKPDFAEILFTQTMLKVSFESRADLESEDLAVIKQLGFKFRGGQAWPLFRSFRPGYMPWFITGAESRFLAAAIGQAFIVGMTVKEKPDALNPPHPGEYLVRVAVAGKDEPEWHDEWLEPSPPLDEETVGTVPDVPVEPQLIARVRDKARLRGGTWEVDINPLLAPIGGPGERPYIPLQILVVDHESGIVLDTDMKSLSDYLTGFREHFVEVLNGLGRMPDRILLANRRTEAVLAPIAAALQIPLELSKKLPGVQQIRRSMERFLEGGPGLRV
jgi:hypothetical protein